MSYLVISEIFWRFADSIRIFRSKFYHQKVIKINVDNLPKIHGDTWALREILWILFYQPSSREFSSAAPNCCFCHIWQTPADFRYQISFFQISFDTLFSQITTTSPDICEALKIQRTVELFGDCCVMLVHEEEKKLRTNRIPENTWQIKNNFTWHET